MRSIADHPLMIFLCVLGNIASLVTLGPMGLAMAVTVSALLLLMLSKLGPASETQIKESDEAIIQNPTTRNEAKEWIDCAYCDGSSRIIKDRTIINGVLTNTEYETCGICEGRGEILTALWSQPKCRRCNGSGKLVSNSADTINLGLMTCLRPLKQIVPCDVCDGSGRRPFHPDECE